MTVAEACALLLGRAMTTAENQARVACPDCGLVQRLPALTGWNFAECRPLRPAVGGAGGGTGGCPACARAGCAPSPDPGDRRALAQRGLARCREDLLAMERDRRALAGGVRAARGDRRCLLRRLSLPLPGGADRRAGGVAVGGARASGPGVSLAHGPAPLDDARDLSCRLLRRLQPAAARRRRTRARGRVVPDGGDRRAAVRADAARRENGMGGTAAAARAAGVEVASGPARERPPRSRSGDRLYGVRAAGDRRARGRPPARVAKPRCIIASRIRSGSPPPSWRRLSCSTSRPTRSRC